MKNFVISVLVSFIFCLILGGVGLGFSYANNKDLKGKLEKMDQRLSLLENKMLEEVSMIGTDNDKLVGGVEEEMQLMPEPQSWETFSDEQYGFSFDYPSNWKRVDRPKDYMSEPKEIFKVEFSDPAWDKKIFEYDCKTQLNKEGCNEYLAGLSEEEKDDIDDYPKGKRNIFLYIYKDEGKGLEDWLVDYFRIPDSQLQTYLPGQKIVMAGETGFLSNIGCCGGYDQSYVIKKNGYVYRLGTNYGEDYLDGDISALLRRLTGTAKFLD
ncbi:MAG: hypothetical protein ACOZAR_04495 [Patescibacteria group bacterium]